MRLRIVQIVVVWLQSSLSLTRPFQLLKQSRQVLSRPRNTANGLQERKHSENLEPVSSKTPIKQARELEESLDQLYSANDEVQTEHDKNIIETIDDLRLQLTFLKQAGLVGLLTALGIVIFKLSIQETSKLFYESLADFLPKPAAFYWPQILYPVLGSAIVSLITYTRGLGVRNGIDTIAQSLDYDTENVTEATSFSPYNPTDLLFRVGAAVATLGSGCSLGPEGPAVEIGAGLSRIFCSGDTPQQKRHLFLAGTAAGVSAGFNAPIAGVFFAIECGKRFLKVNTVNLEAEVKDGPRADIAAIVLAATVAKVVVELGLQESNALSIQGNTFAMQSPLFELPLYLGLGTVAGVIATTFTRARDLFTSIFGATNTNVNDENVLKGLVARMPVYLRPMIGGLSCGLVALYYPQTVFVGYATLDQLLAGKIHLPLEFLLQLLVLKIFLSSFSLGTGLIGGVFAPSLFFGAVAGTMYHDVICTVFQFLNQSILALTGNDLTSYFSIAGAPAYATVGAAATLGAVFRAPLTATILMLEITENHDIVLPVLVSSGLAGFFAEIVRGRPTATVAKNK